MSKHLTVIIKTVERCNLNCSYCYFFNGLDQSYKNRPKFISRQTIDNIALFLQEEVRELGIEELGIGLHGGEPLMQHKEDFKYLIEKLQSSLPNIDLYFTLQTNATLVTEKWINLLNHYKVSVGVSFDGPREYHDKYRITHNGLGSYDNVVRGIKLLQDKLLSSPGCLTVVNPEIGGDELYYHLTELGFKKIDLLLPDFTHDRLPPFPISRYKEFMIEVFDAWMKNNDAAISIRKFKSIILQLLGKAPVVYGFGKITIDALPILSIRSDGSISPTDELMSTDPTSVTFTGANVESVKLVEVINYSIFKEIRNASETIPKKCSNCCWYNACGSGGLVSRFSIKNRFNNHSIYCEALEEIFAHIAANLIKSGVPEHSIYDNLFLKRSGIYA